MRQAQVEVLATYLVVRVNGCSVKNMTPKALRSYLGNKMAVGSFLMLGIDRKGKTEFIVIKTD